MDDLAGQRDRADLFRRQTLRKRAELDKHRLYDPSVTDFHDLSCYCKERSQKFAPKDHRWPSRS